MVQPGRINKILFKYINKGPDRTTVSIVKNGTNDGTDGSIDEIKEYYDCRYLSACEASWRIYAYDVHYRTPSVIRLPFHLPGQQQVVYGTDDDNEDVLNKTSVASTMFLEWMKCSSYYTHARELNYVEFPTKFVWNADGKCWQPRKRGFSLGRIHSVSPSLGEAYYLRILLNKVKGPRDACYALGLLDDDKEYIEAIEEASSSGSGYYLRSLFATMLLSNSLSRPEYVWNNTWKYLSDDILYKQRNLMNASGLSLSEDQIKNLTLFEIESILQRNNCSLRNYNSMPFPDDESILTSNNLLINEEMAYDRDRLTHEFQGLLDALTNEQRKIFDDIIMYVEECKGGVFFVYGYGGTGKTFLWKTLSSFIRSKGEIVLNVASSGIASLLLSGGRTAHSRFKIPLNLNEDSVCHVKRNSDIAHLLKMTKLIIWDEAPMIHKHAFEALDRTLKDLLTSDAEKSNELPFGGKVVVFGGDFRQILPVVPNGSRQDIVNASISSSYIWQKCKIHTLPKNMRLTVGVGQCNITETNNFANWLLKLGEGDLGGSNDGEATIDIPHDLLITNLVDPISDLIEFVYPSIITNSENPTFFQERAILAPKNEVVQEINDRLLSLFPGDEKEYLSSDSISQEEYINDTFDENLCLPDFLNGIKVSGLPNHSLVLKVGVPVMLLRNIDQKSGLCNGTRLKVISLCNHVIEAEIISSSNVGTRTLVPRLSLTPSDKRIPFKFKRRQFPLAVCFAMTINKSQGQSLSRVGLYLKEPVFTHGQLYVVLSRVKSRDGLKLLALDSDGKPTNVTKNVVYKEVFAHL